MYAWRKKLFVLFSATVIVKMLLFHDTGRLGIDNIIYERFNEYDCYLNT